MGQVMDTGLKVAGGVSWADFAGRASDDPTSSEYQFGDVTRGLFRYGVKALGALTGEAASPNTNIFGSSSPPTSTQGGSQTPPNRGNPPSIDFVWSLFHEQAKRVLVAAVQDGVVTREELDTMEPYLFLGVPALLILHVFVRSLQTMHVGAPASVPPGESPCLSFTLASGHTIDPQWVATLPPAERSLWPNVLRSAAEFRAAVDALPPLPAGVTPCGQETMRGLATAHGLGGVLRLSAADFLALQQRVLYASGDREPLAASPELATHISRLMAPVVRVGTDISKMPSFLARFDLEAVAKDVT
eukprot:TRINITY_DN23935_c0_g1_i1.p1 TRINITY_DN23935_c0_g1~~TRINITY_DN23935_c0_g1_i1.p1  ORF type:complete len:302 (+),score=34.73 TRINITY_DN23935_c0_g1_i1:75-980(+)